MKTNILKIKVLNSNWMEYLVGVFGNEFKVTGEWMR